MNKLFLPRVKNIHCEITKTLLVTVNPNKMKKKIGTAHVIFKLHYV